MKGQIQSGNESNQSQQSAQNQPTVQKKESAEVIQNKLANAIPSPQSELPPIQTKQSGLTPYQSPAGQKPTYQAKQRPVQRNTGNGKSSGNVNEAQVKANVSNIMGVDVTQAQVHYNSSKPAQLKAEAYAQGNTVEIAPGKEKHLGHELAHIAQQAQGRVQPTIQGNNGIGINNDPKLEKEADEIGDQAMSMKPTQLKQNSTMKSSVSNTQQGAPVQGKFGQQLIGLSKLQLQEEIAKYYHPAPFLRKLDELENDKNVYNSVHEIGRYLNLEPTGYQESKNKKVDMSSISQKPQHINKKKGKPAPHANYMQSELIISEMTKLRDEKEDMKWMGSKAPSFSEWLNNSDKNANLPDDANCWNAVLLAAFQAGLVDKSYIKKANEQAYKNSSDPIPKIARQIAENPSGSILVNRSLRAPKVPKPKKIKGPKPRNKKKEPEPLKDHDVQQRDWLNRVRGQYQNIPRGHVILIGSNGTHVCLSLGGGLVMELDARQIVQVKNPDYDPKYDANEKRLTSKIRSLGNDVKSLNMRLSKIKDAKDTKHIELTEKLKTKTQALEQATNDYKTFKQTKSKTEFLSSGRPRNEIQSLDLLTRKYFDQGQYVNLDGIFWAPLPLDIII